MEAFKIWNGNIRTLSPKSTTLQSLPTLPFESLETANRNRETVELILFYIYKMVLLEKKRFNECDVRDSRRRSTFTRAEMRPLSSTSSLVVFS